MINKTRVHFELDVSMGHSYGVKAAAAPTHSAFISAASSGSNLNYSNQQNIPSGFQSSVRSDSIMECVLHSFVAENEPDQCNVKTVDDIRPVRSDHAAENKTGEVEKVYGMMAGLHGDNGGVDVSDPTAEFAIMGISPKGDPKEFQLPDENQVVLRIPREHDLYTFRISDLQPEQKVTCLVAKASLDESTVGTEGGSMLYSLYDWTHRRYKRLHTLQVHKLKTPDSDVLVEHSNWGSSVLLTILQLKFENLVRIMLDRDPAVIGFYWWGFYLGGFQYILFLPGLHPLYHTDEVYNFSWVNPWALVKTIHDFLSLLMCARISLHLASSHLPLGTNGFENHEMPEDIVVRNSSCGWLHKDTDKRRALIMMSWMLSVAFFYGEMKEEVYGHSALKALKIPYFPKHVYRVLPDSGYNVLRLERVQGHPVDCGPLKILRFSWKPTVVTSDSAGSHGTLDSETNCWIMDSLHEYTKSYRLTTDHHMALCSDDAHRCECGDFTDQGFDGPRFEYLVVLIGMVNVSILLLVVISFCGRLVSADRSWFAGSYPFCWTIGSFPFLWTICFAGRTIVLLGWLVILSAERLVSVMVAFMGSAGSYTFCWLLCFVADMDSAARFRVHAWWSSLLVDSFCDRLFYAANTSIHAAGLVCAGGIMFAYKDDHNPIRLLGEAKGFPRTSQMRLLDVFPVASIWTTFIRGSQYLTPPMLPLLPWQCCCDEENVAAHAVAGSPAEAHPVPHPPPFSPVREPTPERQPETEWVVPIPVSPITDWRPWPSVPAHSPIRDPTSEPAPAGYVDPDVLEPILFGPQPRPSDFVDPDLEEPVIFRSPTVADNYIEPERTLINIASLEDDTIHFFWAEDPTLLTSLSAKLDRCMGRIDSLETELGTSKKIMGGAILTLVSRVKKLERTVKRLKTARFGGDAPATEDDVTIQDAVDLEGLSRMASEALGHDQPAGPSEHMEEREEEEVPLRRKRGGYNRPRQRLEEETGRHGTGLTMFDASLVQILHLARELLGDDGSTKTTLFERSMTAIKECGVPVIMVTYHYESCLLVEKQLMKNTENICRPPPLSGFAAPTSAGVPDSTVPTSAAMDTAGSHRESGVSPFVDSDDSSSPSPVSTDHIPIDVLFDSTSGGLHEFFLASDEDAPIVEDFFSSESESDDDMETYIPPIPYGAFKDWEIVRCPLSNTYYHVYYQENRRQQSFFYLKELLPHVYREDLLLLRRRMNRTQEDLGGSSWKLYPKSSVHDVTPTGSQFTPLNCRRLLLLGVAVIQAIDSSAFTGESYECLAAAPMLPILRWYHFQIPVGMKNGLVQAQRLCEELAVKRLWLWIHLSPGVNNWKVMRIRLQFYDFMYHYLFNVVMLGAESCADSCCCKRLEVNVALLYLLVVPADSSSSIPADDVPADSSSSIPADDVPAGSSSSVPADYVSAGHVLVSADRDRIC
ncbi:hypothetical protein Tco_0465893 [Tanacetum coccineum]